MVDKGKKGGPDSNRQASQGTDAPREEQSDLSEISRKEDPLRSPGVRKTGKFGQDLSFAGMGLQKVFTSRRLINQSIQYIQFIILKNDKIKIDEISSAHFFKHCCNNNRIRINPELEGICHRPPNQRRIIHHGC